MRLYDESVSAFLLRQSSRVESDVPAHIMLHPLGLHLLNQVVRSTTSADYDPSFVSGWVSVGYRNMLNWCLQAMTVGLVEGTDQSDALQLRGRGARSLTTEIKIP